MLDRDKPTAYSGYSSQRSVSTSFAALVDLRSRDFLAVEALNRGRQGSPLHSPAELFSKGLETRRHIRELELSALRNRAKGFLRRSICSKLFVTSPYEPGVR